METFFFAQGLIEYYYKTTVEAYYAQMKAYKVQPDEMNLLLVSKMVRCNITVVTSKGIWSVYQNSPPDIVIGYKGKDKKGKQGKWVGTITFRDPSLRSKFNCIIN